MNERSHVLVQLLLPVQGGQGTANERLGATRTELVDRFGGATAYLQSPALGDWEPREGDRDQDRVILVEVVAPAPLDRRWWRDYSVTLARRFNQETMHIRAMAVDLIDPAGD